MDCGAVRQEENREATKKIQPCKDGGHGEDQMIGCQGEGERETNDLTW